MKNCACCCGIGLLLLFAQNESRGQISPPLVSSTPSQSGSAMQITLGWDPSPDPSATGYYVAWGTVTGQCTNLVDVGSVTNAFASGFATNATYCFTIVAYDAVGDQAPPSNEIQYTATNPVVANPPSITADLTNQTLAAGASTTVYVGVSGTSPFTFAWFFNGGSITTATTNTLELNNVKSGQAGAYQVVISNSAGSVTSSIANIAVLYPPSITLDLTNETVATGSTASFAVNVAGSGPLGFSWLFNGTLLQGANSNPLVLNNVSAQQAGTYQVVVSNAVGSATGQVATLSVQAPPNITANLTNESVAVGANASFQLGVSGTSPFTYQWFFNGKQVTGAAGNSLALNSVSSANAGAYQVVAGNSVGSVTSAVAVLSVLVPPSITQDLTNVSAIVASTVSLQVQAAGSDPLGYQWQFAGTNVLGANTNCLVLANIGAAQTGSYQVVVTNTVGSVTSAVANVTIVSAPSITVDITNETVATDGTATFAVKVTGSSPNGFAWLFNGALLQSANSNPLVLSNVSGAQAGTYQVIVSNSVGSVTGQVATLSVQAPPIITANLTNESAVVGGSASFQVGVTGSSPLAYQWFFNGKQLSGATSTSLALNNVSSGDAGAYQVVIGNSVGSATSAVAVLNVLGPPSIIQDLTNQSVAAGSTVSLAVQATGSDPLGYQWQFGGTNIFAGNTNSLVLTNVDGSSAGNYQVIITNSAGSVTSSVAAITVLWPPNIVLDLTNQTALGGSSVTMSVQATGTAPLSYQWYFNSAQISGANNATLTLTSVSPSQAGAYQVTISNPVGVVTSAVANLTVLAPPVITMDISNQTVVTGAQLTFSLGVSGTAPLVYQWFYNGAPLSGATTNPLVLSKISTSQAGTYQATVSNLLGSAQSSTATLTVLQNKMLHAHQYTSSLISLSFAAAPLQSYTVQSSTNLSGPWTVDATATTDQYGVLTYEVDPTMPVKFYRITSP